MVATLTLQDKYEYPTECDDDVVISVLYDAAGELKAGTAASVWDASIVAGKYLEIARKKQDQPSKRILELGNDAKILELGSGTGLLSKVLRKVFPLATIIATDLPAVQPLLHVNLCDKEESKVLVRSLEWGKEQDSEKIIEEFGDRFDLIVLSDLITWPSLYKDLVKTLDRLVGKETSVLAVHESRSFEKEAVFFRLLHDSQIRFRHVDQKDQHPLYRSEDIFMFWMNRG